MFKLIKTNDKNVLNNSNFAKNAVLYKDMLSFAEAYSKITQNKDKLPNFCFLPEGELCLEGVCLLMKMYATEFKFETMKLTLDYLKILYYTCASFADEDGFVDSEKIISEFDEYRNASLNYSDEKKKELDAKKQLVEQKNKEVDLKQTKVQSLAKWSKINLVLAVVFLAFSIVSITLPIIVVNNYSVSSVEFALSVAGVVVGFLITLALKFSSKKMLNLSQDLSFHVQSLKKNLDSEKTELDDMQAKYYRIYSEKYEYEMCFSHILSKFGNVLEIDEILSKAKEYKLLSYNIVYDINRLFKSQQREIDGLVLDIENVVMSDDSKEDFANLYSEIKNQDWLFYNSEIRFHFIKKFADFSEKTHVWKLEMNGQKIDPFDVNIKDLSREIVAFSASRNEKLISIPLSDFMKTKYFKNLGDLNFSNGYSVDALKRVKSNYLSHFYNPDIVSDEKDLFFDEKKKTTKLSQNSVLENSECIPTLVNLKLKLIESSTGLGNSDAKIIKSISQSIFSDEKNETSDNMTISENDIEYPKFNAESIKETDETIVYKVGKTEKTGYKIDWQSWFCWFPVYNNLWEKICLILKN